MKCSLYDIYTLVCMIFLHFCFSWDDLRLFLSVFDCFLLKSIIFAVMSENKNTILIVDDNTAILTALKICLDGVFDRIITLSTPDNILTTLQQECVDVVLLDMNFTLGVNSGQEGLMWLRTIHKLHPDVPVVLVTAYADVKLAVRGLKTGAVDFVTKPWDNDELIRVLKDAIDKSEAVVPLEQLESEHVRKVVDKCHGNMSKAAELLGITRQTLYNKVRSPKSS